MGENERMRWLVGREILTPDGRRGWVGGFSETCRPAGALDVSVYGEDEERVLRVTDVTLLAPQTDPLPGWHAVNMLSPQGLPWVSLRMTDEHWDVVTWIAKTRRVTEGEAVVEMLREGLRSLRERDGQ